LLEQKDFFSGLYARFEAPITALDCGKKCAPYNEHGVPFCCDTRHAVPVAYNQEWAYLNAKTDLWHIWQGADPEETRQLEDETPDGMVLIACLGHTLCQRGYRSLTCRAFPFFPYLDAEKEFLGLSYYWEYADRCWVISNLQVVSPEYRGQFVEAFEDLFAQMPQERESYARHSAHMRRVFLRQRRTIPLLHRDGCTYKISPRTGKLRQIDTASLPKYGPYRIMAQLPFPDEL
jgi:hypothetical protein